MNTLKDKHLLLLGILRSQDMHGYRLNEMFKSPSTGLHIGKANAYQLLAKLENKGYVTRQEERIENRPPRQVYTLTPDGENEFQRLVRERLAEHVSADYT